MYVSPSQVTQSHMTHSARCSIVWFCQDSSTRCPVHVPGRSAMKPLKNMQAAKLSLGVAWSAYHQDRTTNNLISDQDMAHLP